MFLNKRAPGSETSALFLRVLGFEPRAYPLKGECSTAELNSRFGLWDKGVCHVGCLRVMISARNDDRCLQHALPLQDLYRNVSRTGCKPWRALILAILDHDGFLALWANTDHCNRRASQV